MLDRRSLMMASLAATIAMAAKADDAPPSPSPTDTIAAIKTAAEPWTLLTAMNALIYIMATAVLKDDKVVYQSLGEFQPYSAQLTGANSMDAFNAALKSDEGLQRSKEAASTVDSAAAEVGKLLASVVSDGLRDDLVQAFRRVSLLLAARASTNKQWWCHVYAFRKIAC